VAQQHRQGPAGADGDLERRRLSRSAVAVAFGQPRAHDYSMGFIGASLRLLGVVAGLLEIVHRMKGVRRLAAADAGARVSPDRGDGRLTDGAGAAGRASFDRDRARLELERARFEAEHRRADESLRLERLRQAAARQAGEVRLIAWVAVAGWLASAVVALRFGGAAGLGARVLLGTGWVALLAALACALSAHAGIARAYASRLEDGSVRVTFTSLAGTRARRLLVAGLGFVGAGFLLHLA
jgi:hypothetical protein